MCGIGKRNGEKTHENERKKKRFERGERDLMNRVFAT